MPHCSLPFILLQRNVDDVGRSVCDVPTYYAFLTDVLLFFSFLFLFVLTRCCSQLLSIIYSELFYYYYYVSKNKKRMNIMPRRRDTNRTPINFITCKLPCSVHRKNRKYCRRVFYCWQALGTWQALSVCTKYEPAISLFINGSADAI